MRHLSVLMKVCIHNSTLATFSIYYICAFLVFGLCHDIGVSLRQYIVSLVHLCHDISVLFVANILVFVL